jgi:hypothetical protein
MYLWAREGKGFRDNYCLKALLIEYVDLTVDGHVEFQNQYKKLANLKIVLKDSLCSDRFYVERRSLENSNWPWDHGQNFQNVLQKFLFSTQLRLFLAVLFVGWLVLMIIELLSKVAILML